SIGRGFAHLSLETRRHRLFTEAAKLAPGHGALLVLADGDRHLAWGIATLVDGIEHGIGVARVIRDPSSPEAAEFAIAIVEDWQRHGAGLLLAQALAARSREIGIRRWVGVGYLENRGILALLSRVGREVSRASFGDGSAAIAYEL
ncbi:MAG: GNAT family N-acetyltransferase, partial [Polyangiales bacterium]